MLKFAVLALVCSSALAATYLDGPFSSQKLQQLMAQMSSINLVAETSFFTLEVPMPSIMARSGVYAIDQLAQMKTAIDLAAKTGERNLEAAVQKQYDDFKLEEAQKAAQAAANAPVPAAPGAPAVPAGRKRRDAPAENEINYDDYELMVQIEA